MDTHERCFLCSFWNGTRCTQTFRLLIHVEPCDGAIGGQVDFSCTPGMVPEELKPKLSKYFGKFLEKLLPVISTMPVWDEVAEWQAAHLPECKDCPGRKERDDIKPYLRVVKAEI